MCEISHPFQDLQLIEQIFKNIKFFVSGEVPEKVSILIFIGNLF